MNQNHLEVSGPLLLSHPLRIDLQVDYQLPMLIRCQFRLQQRFLNIEVSKLLKKLLKRRSKHQVRRREENKWLNLSHLLPNPRFLRSLKALKQSKSKEAARVRMDSHSLKEKI